MNSVPELPLEVKKVLHVKPNFVSFLPVLTSQHWALAKTPRCRDLAILCGAGEEDDRTGYFTPCACASGTDIHACFRKVLGLDV